MMTIRPAQISDIADLWRVRSSVRENVLHAVITDEECIDMIEGDGRTWVYEENGEIVAFAGASKSTGNLWAHFVDPHFEHRGIGTALLDVVTAWLWSEGVKKIWVTTEPQTRAEAFYRELGWNRESIEPNGEIRYELSR